MINRRSLNISTVQRSNIFRNKRSLATVDDPRGKRPITLGYPSLSRGVRRNFVSTTLRLDESETSESWVSVQPQQAATSNWPKVNPPALLGRSHEFTYRADPRGTQLLIWGDPLIGWIEA